jgi:uncharacterized protein YlzI (FlbEa/FlbD family)
MSDKSVNKDSAGHDDSFSELLIQLAKSSAIVVHDEIELVIQRIREMAKAARIGFILVATGAVISFAALMCVCGALIIGLTSYMSPVSAALVSGFTFALAGVALVFSGYRQLKKSVSLRDDTKTKMEEKEWLK